MVGHKRHLSGSSSVNHFLDNEDDSNCKNRVHFKDSTPSSSPELSDCNSTDTESSATEKPASGDQLSDSLDGRVVTHCSLLTIKERLEYHLISLKTILNTLSDSAEFITQRYLQDIECDDSLDLTVPTADSALVSTPAPNRHYYTGN